MPRFDDPSRTGGHDVFLPSIDTTNFLSDQLMLNSEPELMLSPGQHHFLDDSVSLKSCLLDILYS